MSALQLLSLHFYFWLIRAVAAPTYTYSTIVRGPLPSVFAFSFFFRILHGCLDAKSVDLLSSRGVGALPSNRLMGMYCWMGSHFHGWIDYNGVACSIELPEWGRIFSGF